MTLVGPWILAQTGPAQARELLADASVYLITGGLVVLGIIVILVLIRSLFPASRSSTAALERGRDIVLKPTPNVEEGGEPGGDFEEDAFGEGQKAARSDRADSVHDAVRSLENRGAGKPRILQVARGRVHVRLYDCEECQSAGATEQGCGRQAGYLAEAVGRAWDRRAQVRETACRRRQAPACEFEVAAQ